MKDNNEKIIFWGIDFGNCLEQSTGEMMSELLTEGKEPQQKPTTVATVNPEMLLLADNKDYYKKAISSFDWKTIDGFGISLMGAIKKKKVPKRLPGADLAGQILKESIKQNKSVALVFNKQGLSKEKDLKNFLKKIAAENIHLIEYDICKAEEEAYNQKINQKLADTSVVLVGLGMPHQELFIHSNAGKWRSAVLAMGVGGTFDFWCGTQKRAPKFLRKIGFEWCWRLITRPKRLIRIWRSTIVFMFRSLLKD